MRFNRALNSAELLPCQTFPFGRTYHDVRAEIAEFPLQLALHVRRKVEHSSCSSRGDADGEQRCNCTALSQDGGTRQHTKKHRALLMATAHASPRKAWTASLFTARRIAMALPANVTPIARLSTTGSNTGCTTIDDPKIVRPSWVASREPAPNPRMPPIIARRTDS